MKRTWLWPLIPALMGLLSACAGNESALIGYRSYDAAYFPAETRQGYPAVRAVIRGTPFIGLGEARSAAAVLAAMQNGGFFQTRFTLARVPHSPYWVAVLFDPPPDMDAGRACALDPDRLARRDAAPPRGGRVALVMALCRDGARLSGADGTIAVPAGPDDPTFRRAIGDFLMALIPAINPMNPLPYP